MFNVQRSETVAPPTRYRVRAGFERCEPFFDSLGGGHVSLPMAQLELEAPRRAAGSDGNASNGARVVPAPNCLCHNWPCARCVYVGSVGSLYHVKALIDWLGLEANNPWPS